MKTAGDEVAVFQLVEVGTGDERLLARTGDDEHAQGIVGLDLREGGVDLLHRGIVSRVAELGPVDSECRHGACDFEKNVLEHGYPLL